jgi:hypothetical protein
MPGSDKQAVAALRGAVYRGDGAAVVEILGGRPMDPVLQLAGDGLLAAVAGGVDGAADLAARCVALLQERSAWGDEELAEELDAALGRGPTPMLRQVPVDLDELSSALEGDPLYGGGRLDLRTGELWHESPDGFSEDEEEELLDPDRWLHLEALGSREGYRDMELFAQTIEDKQLADLLEVALDGRGAFRRFKDVLAREPDELQRWFTFSEDRRRGRARAWLAGCGYRPSGAGRPRSG